MFCFAFFVCFSWFFSCYFCFALFAVVPFFSSSAVYLFIFSHASSLLRWKLSHVVYITLKILKVKIGSIAAFFSFLIFSFFFAFSPSLCLSRSVSYLRCVIFPRVVLWVFYFNRISAQFAYWSWTNRGADNRQHKRFHCVIKHTEIPIDSVSNSWTSFFSLIPMEYVFKSNKIKSKK